jgi:hypothetical protein
VPDAVLKYAQHYQQGTACVRGRECACELRRHGGNGPGTQLPDLGPPVCCDAALHDSASWCSACPAGGEGSCRPSSAAPSALKQQAQQQPLPAAAAQLSQRFMAGGCAVCAQQHGRLSIRERPASCVSFVLWCAVVRRARGHQPATHGALVGPHARQARRCCATQLTCSRPGSASRPRCAVCMLHARACACNGNTLRRAAQQRASWVRYQGTHCRSAPLHCRQDNS